MDYRITVLPSAFYRHAITMATETNLQYRSIRSITCPAKLFSGIPPHLYSICYYEGCPEPQASKRGRKKLPFHRKKPGAEHGSKGGTLLLLSRGGGGQKEESNRHLEQTKLSSLGCCGVTLAFRTVQWSELVPLSYKRSNSNVPKEAVITISVTLLYSITSTYKLVNSHPPHTPNCPLSCMHFYSVNLKKDKLQKRQKISLPTLNRVKSFKYIFSHITVQ